jgi:hypothetical protein
MRRDGHDRVNRVNQRRYEKALTVGDLCQGIAERRIPAQRDGDEYIVRVADMRAVGECLSYDGLGMAPDNETSSLEVGRFS